MHLFKKKHRKIKIKDFEQMFKIANLYLGKCI